MKFKNTFLLCSQLTESTLFPDGTRVYFRCEGPPGLRYAREGNASLFCEDGRWSTKIPFCRPTPTRRQFSGNFFYNMLIFAPFMLYHLTQFPFHLHCPILLIQIITFNNETSFHQYDQKFLRASRHHFSFKLSFSLQKISFICVP